MAASIAALITIPTSRARAHLVAISSRRPFLSTPYCLLDCSHIPSTISHWDRKLGGRSSQIFPSSSIAFSPTIVSPLPALEADTETTPNAPPSLLRRALLCALLWASLSFVFHFLACGCSLAATNDSIRASGFGLKVATALRQSGWADEAIVFALATLPVLELRGAIPVGYWMNLHPLHLTILSVLGNMVPVPFIVLFLKRVASFLSRNSTSATKFLDIFLKKAKEKAGPVEEFQWLGLMLFVAVPFPGTGAWTGAIVASILDMPFWSAVSANFVGVVLAGLLVNLLVSLGLKYAVIVGVVLFFVSTVMWNVLRHFKKALDSK